MLVEFGETAGEMEIYITETGYLHNHMRLPTKGSPAGGESSRFKNIWSSKDNSPVDLKSIFGSKSGLFLPGQTAESKLIDKLLINVVHNVDITPKHKTIFFHEGKDDQYSFKYTILHGSGNFFVTLNDSSLADKQVKGRSIQIIPRRAGSLQITVQDSDLPLSTPTTATLHISPITSLHLYSPVQLIE